MKAPQQLDQHQIGLYPKFKVQRTDDKDAPGMKHEHDEYFVLNLSTDKHAIPAITAYIESCAAEYPKLADDLRAKIAEKSAADSVYITVPEVTLPGGRVVPSFRVSKYLASRAPGNFAASTEDGAPWIEINYHEARQAALLSCCSLITESQALAIAHDISQQDINWTGGKVGEGNIYMGLHKGSVDEAQPATYESPDSEERRWHQLSNGERIYDLSGNCFSWVSDDVQGDENGLTTIIKSDSPSLTTAPYSSMQNGMGWRPDGERNWSGDALVRGGYWCSESNAGVFDLNYDWADRRRAYVGFRCTKSL